MNMADQQAEAILTITYEFVPSPSASFAHVKPLWLDIGGCGGSEKPAFMNKSFHYTCPDWTVPGDGRVTFIASHLHDGGTHLEVSSNGVIVCDSIAAYGQSPAYVGSMSMNMTMNGMTMPMNMSMSHISSMSTCSNHGVMSAGDKWSLTAHYNTSLHAPMTNMNGGLEPIMGIAIVYYAEGTSVNASNGTSILMNNATRPGQTGNPSAAQTNGASSFAISTVKSMWFLAMCSLILCL